MKRFFKNSELSLFMQVQESKGFAVRVLSDGEDKRFESYTFGDRTLQYIVDGLEYGNVVEIEEPEFKTASEKFISWASNQVLKNIKM